MCADQPPELMTSHQFNSLACLMRLRPGAQRDAVALVMVQGWNVDQAADHVGTALFNVQLAVQSARVARDLARQVVQG